MESAMTAMLRDASGKMHHGILFDPPLPDVYVLIMKTLIRKCTEKVVIFQLVARVINLFF